jgi:hypothetical protein
MNPRKRGVKQRVCDDLVRRPSTGVPGEEWRRGRRAFSNGNHEVFERFRLAFEDHWKRIVGRWACIPGRGTIGAIEGVGDAVPRGALPEDERFGIREARKRASGHLEQAVRRILVEHRRVERHDGRDPRALHVGADRCPDERQRLVRPALEQQIRAAPPLACGHIPHQHECHRRHEHGDDEDHDGRQSDSAIGNGPAAEGDVAAHPSGDGSSRRVQPIEAGRRSRRLGPYHFRTSRSR